MGNLEQALQFFEKYNSLERELYEAYPSNVGFKNGLAVSYLYLGQTEEKLNNIANAKKYYLQGQKLYQELVKDFPTYHNFRQNLQWVENHLKTLA